jgi:methionine synthase II (cobalamin-independent)
LRVVVLGGGSSGEHFVGALRRLDAAAELTLVERRLVGGEHLALVEPLESLPDDKVVVLGLVSSKFAELESPEQLIGRIEEAARFYPRDQLALSTQCGFASAGPGNAITEDAQEKKLHLIAEVAARAWG